MKNFSAILLAGGSSKRMGYDKRLAGLRGETLLESSANKLKELTGDVIVVTARRDNTANTINNVKIIHDLESGRGPLMGIYSGLKACKNKSAVVIPVDTPFVTSGFLKHMAERSSGFDLTVPRWKRGIEPLVAVYSKTLVKVLKSWLDSGNKPAPHLLTQKLEKGNINFIEEDEIQKFGDPEFLFHNINTEDDISVAIKYSESKNERYQQ